MRLDQLEAAELFEGALLSIALAPVSVTDVYEAIAVLTSEVGESLDGWRTVLLHRGHLDFLVVLQRLGHHQLAYDFYLVPHHALVAEEFGLRPAIRRHSEARDGPVKLDEDKVIARLERRDL